ncbi:MAG: flagellar M-ring protein FliF C-terminal domain-containing protein [Candidatus Melainabacteria bacterium]|nr:flagellar M-ring protein FliF C-terminal domain-containing protein [Candidatus Melainabacteria bacterium]
MPPQIQQFLQNRQMVAIAGGVALLLVIIIVVLVMNSGGPKEPGDKKIDPVKHAQLATVPNVGKALEIQALLAREGIHVDLEKGTGSNMNILLPAETTMNERDRAVISLVQSGLMDRNVGLEAFDQGDLTASREEKRIKLIRAQQGELARLIRKIDPIEDASVSLSIPDSTIFKSQQKPISASVQVSIPSGTRLGRDKVRSIINLMVGSIQDLTAHNVALSDTNGNTYNSVLDASAELMDKLEEQDQYMKQKVSAQLDKLVGAGHYVVTVSTLLREAPRETMVQSYDPSQSALATKQKFTEELNASTEKTPSGPVSSFIPKELDKVMEKSGSNKGYNRSGVEMTYQNGKTQWIETSVPGMIEDISIAITLDRDHMPTIPKEELRQLIARAASPKVDAANVSIADTAFEKPAPLTDSDTKPESENSVDWVFWAIVGGGLSLLVLLAVLWMSRNQTPPTLNLEVEETQREVQELRQQMLQQEQQYQQQLQASKQETQQLLENQQQTMAALQSQLTAPKQDTSQLQRALMDLRKQVEAQADDLEDEELPIKSWIESS